MFFNKNYKTEPKKGDRCALRTYFIGAHPFHVQSNGCSTVLCGGKQNKMGKCRFNSLWLDNSGFSGWLQPVPGDVYGACCTLCKKTLKLGTLGVRSLESHARSVRHKAAVKEEQLMPVISHYCSMSVSGASTPTDLQTAFGATPTLEDEPSPVVQLNVGGHLFSTSLSTIRKHPESKLAELFSRPPKLRTDAQGRYFIDRDGSHFGAVLEFLRSDLLPTENIQEVHGEAVYYNIKPLVKRLEETPQLFGELVGRQQFLSRIPHYKENIEVLIRIARAEAIAARHSTIMICILRTEEELGFYENAINSLAADKESVVTFGPWKAVLSVKDLLDCVKMDIESQGYKVSIQPHVVEKNFLSRSYDYFHKLIFTWW